MKEMSRAAEGLEEGLLESEEEGKHVTIYETVNFKVCAYGHPMVSREEGGHIIIAIKEDVEDRTKLSPKLAKEYIRLSMLVGESMEKAMNNRGIPVVKINYADYGNWAYKSKKKARMHLHLFGRATNASKQVFPEAVKLPARESGFYEGFKCLNDEDIQEIRKQIDHLVKLDKYDPVNW